MRREQLRVKYHGDLADDYEASREGTELWQRQQEAVEGFLAPFPAGTRVLDVPVGTGRFLRSYQDHGFEVVGVDASADMLQRARAKGTAAELRVGDIFHLDFPDDAFDLVVCIRFFNWLGPADAQRAFAELARVSRNAVLANVKTYAPLGELSVKRALRQWRRRLVEARNPGNVPHEHALVISLMDRHGFSLVDRALAVPGDDVAAGVENFVYLMRRPPGGQPRTRSVEPAADRSPRVWPTRP